ncbi:MAG: glycosyltransferase, partial [Elusimicrobiales bacterium]|nr:glycosyltransferase [Elusimicrobiales bacterium]
MLPGLLLLGLQGLIKEKKMDVSIIIPAYNEEEGIIGVVDEINSAMSDNGHNYEIIVINDGSTDLTL